MPGPLYVPVLPVRAHAASAFGKLDAQTADRTAPLWTLPVIGGGAGRPAESVQKALRSAVRVQQHRVAWLDAPFTSLDDDPYAELLRHHWSDTPLLPVADPARPRSHQALAAECAAEAGGGLGVRIRVPGAFRDELAAHTEALLAYVGAGVPVDLLLDLQAVLPARPDAAKEAMRALDELVPLAAWRTVALLSGGFPDETGRVQSRAARHDGRGACGGALGHRLLRLPRSSCERGRPLVRGVRPDGRFRGDRQRHDVERRGQHPAHDLRRPVPVRGLAGSGRIEGERIQVFRNGAGVNDHTNTAARHSLKDGRIRGACTAYAPAWSGRGVHGESG